MKTNAKSKLVYLAVATLMVLSFASCGNSQKAKQQDAAMPAQDSVTVMEESVIVEVDSIIPDSAAVKK